jgi:hypothetical protein
MSCCAPTYEEVACGVVTFGGPIWFACAYSGCHAGVGYVVIRANNNVIYSGCPSAGTQKKIYISFDKAPLYQFGGTMTVNYGEGCARGGHRCDSATFNWGYDGSDTVVGTAYLNNASDGGSRFNTFTIPANVANLAPATPPTSSLAKTITRCYIYGNTCTMQWVEAKDIGNCGIHHWSAGELITKIPKGKTGYFATINYASPNTSGSSGFVWELYANGIMVGSQPITLSTLGHGFLSPCPFPVTTFGQEGWLIDSSILAINNTYGTDIEVRAGAGGFAIDDSLAIAISN